MKSSASRTICQSYWLVLPLVVGTSIRSSSSWDSSYSEALSLGEFLVLVSIGRSDLTNGSSFNCSSKGISRDFLKALCSMNFTSCRTTTFILLGRYTICLTSCPPWTLHPTKLLPSYSMEDRLYALAFSLYPTRYPFSTVWSNFFLFSSGIWQYAKLPNILKWLTSGVFPVKTFSGVILPNALCGVLFWI